jgi:hypothetical protein
VETVDQAAAAVARVPSLDRANVRAAFEHRFTIERTAHDYLEMYDGLIRSVALSTRYGKAKGDRKREASHPNGTRVPGLPPTTIVTKRVRLRGKVSAKVLDSSMKAVVPNATSEASRNDVIKRTTSLE